MSDAAVPAPTDAQARIESLDVVRGFALLGILLMNIIGFGLVSTAYLNPSEVMSDQLSLTVWAGIDIAGEGAMRALFSMLFGAGVVLFAAGKSGALYYRRMGLLLLIGLFDAYILLWNGDILVSYAVVGFLLYPLRNVSGSRLVGAGLVLMVLLGLFYGLMGMGLEQLRLNDEQGWQAFVADFQFSPEQAQAELAARSGSYASAFAWNVGATNGMLFFVLPVIMFWDALAFMLLGMGLYKTGVLQGGHGGGFYLRLAAAGFAIGLTVNGYEVYRAIASGFDFLATFAYAQPTYHLGRLGMATGYLCVLVLAVQHGWLDGLRHRLGCTGRMALTNYLLHSLICMFIFTGAGFGLVGQLSRPQLYLVVGGIWLLQLVLSPWWLARFRFGPAEWLWRGLTYGRWPPWRVAVVQ